MKTDSEKKVRTSTRAQPCLATNTSKGKVVNHGFAKELLAGIVGGEVDRLAETKGMDEYDKIQAKRHAERSAENMYNNHYRDADEYNPNQYDQPNFQY